MSTCRPLTYWKSGNMPGKRGSLEERFERWYIPEPMSGCWLWFGSEITFIKGGTYGVIGNSDWRSGKSYAHRVSYELYVGKIPEGYEVDHTCKNTLCVNPEHLQALTRKEHAQITWDRKLQGNCKRGHSMDVKNTWFEKTGAKHCRKCHAEREVRRRLAAKIIKAM